MADPKPDIEAGRLRDRIDEGRTGDKVPWPDPATAPYETGAEASGQPTPRTAAEEDRRQQEEIAAGFDRHVEPMSAAETPERARKNRRFAGWLVAVLAVVAVVAVLAAVGLAPD